MHRSEFLKLLKKDFPHLRESVNKEFGLLHLEMTVLHCYVQELIQKKDINQVKKAFNLVNIGYEKGHSKLRNAIDVSFVEGLKLKNHTWAWKLLPEPLKKLHLDFHGRIYG
jgi:hypothetical protein